MEPASGGRERPGSQADRGPLRIGVIGCGLIAQVMHLPYLHELSDRYSLEAICDLSPTVLAAVGERYAVPTRVDSLAGAARDAARCRAHRDARIARPARRSRPPAGGLHVFVEKPMCFSPAEGRAMIAAARDAGVTLMVGNMKRYDPAVARLAAELAATDGPPTRAGHDARGAIPPVRPPLCRSPSRAMTSTPTGSRRP